MGATKDRYTSVNLAFFAGNKGAIEYTTCKVTVTITFLTMFSNYTKYVRTSIDLTTNYR